MALKSRYSFSLCSWGLNEEKLVEEFVRKSAFYLSQITDDYEIVLVDDGSTDRTWQILQGLEPEFPRLKPVRHEKNLKPGGCLKTCLKYATKQIVFWNTVDMFFDVSKIQDFVPYLDSYDVVQGVRRDRKSNTYKSLYRTFNSVVNYWLIRILFGVPLSDFQNTTFHRLESLKSIRLDSSSNFTNPECVIKSYYRGARIKEVKMDHMDRKAGKAKGGNLDYVLETFFDILKCWMMFFIFKRPGKLRKGLVVQADAG